MRNFYLNHFDIEQRCHLMLGKKKEFLKLTNQPIYFQISFKSVKYFSNGINVAKLYLCLSQETANGNKKGRYSTQFTDLVTQINVGSILQAIQSSWMNWINDNQCNIFFLNCDDILFSIKKSSYLFCIQPLGRNVV